jgi:hypothetical protein
MTVATTAMEVLSGMGVWHGVAMDSLKFHLAHLALPIYALQGSGRLPYSTFMDTPRRTPKAK